MEVAVFDFDGTVCPGDSIVPYIRFCIARGIAPRSQWLRAAGGYLRQRLHPEEVSASKARSLSFIRGRPKAEMDELADAFIRAELQPRFYAGAIGRMRALRDQGLRVVVLSASPSVYMDRIAGFLPADAVLSTPCAVDAEGRYTGEVGANCRDEEKLVRLRAWAGAEDPLIMWAYGDSRHDLPVLREALHPVWVDPDAKMLRLLDAEKIHWR